MPKTKISEYSTTNSDNTDIEGINIAEGCAPSGINNAIRELMVHLKEFQTGASGDAFTFAGGTLMSGTNTISGAAIISGNINSSGSTNTFSGTVVMSGANSVALAAGSVSAPSLSANGDSNTGIFFPAADTIAFAEGGVESGRFTSTGALQLANNLTFTGTGNRITGDFSNATLANRVSFQTSTANSATTVFAIPNGTGTTAGFFANNDSALTNGSEAQLSVGSADVRINSAIRGTGTYLPMTFYTNGSERMRIDTSGNVGIGTSSPIAKLDTATTSDNNLNIIRYAESTSGAVFRIRHSYSNTIGTNTLLPGSGGGYQFGRVEFVGALGTGNDYAVGASIIGLALGSTSSTSMPGVLIFNTTPESSVSPSERARITSGGYFKASNTGTYVNSTGSYHEFNNSSNNECLVPNATNASYSSDVISVSATRSAISSYNFLLAFSGNFNDLEFRLRGDGNGYADGTWNNNGADYAEFFESANGQALTLGATVVLDGNKVREATDQDPASAIIGVVRPKEPSKASMVVGNTAWNKWANKYLTDDFDRYIMEDHDVVEWEEQVLEREAVAAVEAVVDEEGNEVSSAVPAQEAVYKTKQHSYESHNIPAGVTVPTDATVKTHDDKGNKFQHYKLNPAWDKDAEYVNRENRPEWNIIGLLGQVKILKGQPVGDRWTKMRDVSATVEEWMIR